MQDLNITIIQADLVWEDSAKNISRFDAKIESITESVDLIVLPEMFTTGFSMKARQLAEQADGSSVKWMLKKSAQKKVDLVGSLIINDNGKFFNRLFWAKPDGQLFSYDKRHLFRMADEHKTYSAGNKTLTVDLKGWKIRPFVCYDLRFPVWCRNKNNEYDMAVFIANWPERRSNHWRALLAARAIENQCYVAGVNRVGRDGNGIEYIGDSSIIDPLGNELVHQRLNEMISSVRLSQHSLSGYREKFPAWMDGDSFEIRD
ncbi:MAG: amidohydrolase [Calditrichaceae bacterium]